MKFGSAIEKARALSFELHAGRRNDADAAAPRIIEENTAENPQPCCPPDVSVSALQTACSNSVMQIVIFIASH